MFWNVTYFKLDDRNDPAITAVLEAVQKSHCNGGMICRCIRKLIGPAKYDYFRDAKELSSFLSESSVRSILHELELPESFETFPPITRYSAYEFEGAVTSILQHGGAYTLAADRPSDEDARQMARAFVDALLPKSRDLAQCVRIDGAWSSWFCEINWDASFVIRDPKADRWWIVCITDTD